MDWVRLGSICSIKFDWFDSEIELTQSSVFDLVRLPNSIEPNPWIENGLTSIDFDWVRFSNVRFTMPGSSSSTSVLDSLAVEVSESRPFSSNFMRLALVFWPTASLPSLAGLVSSSSFKHQQCGPRSLRWGAEDLVLRWTCWFHQIFASSVSSQTKMSKKFSCEFSSWHKWFLCKYRTNFGRCVDEYVIQ